MSPDWLARKEFDRVWMRFLLIIKLSGYDTIRYDTKNDDVGKNDEWVSDRSLAYLLTFKHTRVLNLV